MNPIKLAVLLPTLVLTGCMTVGHDYSAPVNNPVVLQPAEDFLVAPYEQQWWQHFNDDTLNELVALTLANNRTLAAAEANIERAYARFADVDNDQRPAGSLDLNYQNSRVPQPGAKDEHGYNRSYQAGANLAWQLDFAGKLRRLSESAYASAESVQADFHALQVSLVSNVTNRYVDYRSLQQRVQLAQRNVDILQQTADITRLRLDEGMASEFEYARVQAQLSAVQASIESLTSQLKSAEYDLALLTGYEPASFPLALGSKPIPALAGPVAIGEPAQLLERRPDIRSAERRLAAATAQIGSAKADLYPSINITGFLGFLSGHASGLDSGAEAWTIAPTLSWQALDWGSVQARIKIANAEQKAAAADYQQTVLAALNNAQKSLTAYNYSQRQVHHLADQQQASEKAMKLATLQYQTGVFDLLDLLDTERTLLQARDSYAIGQAQVMKDLIAIYQAFGGALDQASTSQT